jgi:hypothetical protein
MCKDHLNIHFVKEGEKSILFSTKVDQLTRIPIVGEFVGLNGRDIPFEVMRVIHFPNHGTTITVK